MSGHQYGQAAMLQPHDLVAQLADGGALPLNETKLGLQSGAVQGGIALC